MILITKAIEKAIPALYANDGKDHKDIKVAVKFFNPCGSQSWFITEGEKQSDGDWMLYGYVTGTPVAEWGYTLLSTLEDVKLPFGMGIERDRNFGNPTMDRVIKGSMI